jgi:hypothetical protein
MFFTAAVIVIETLLVFIVFEKKTFRHRTVFFYNHLYHRSVCRNVFLKSGIIPLEAELSGRLFACAKVGCQGLTNAPFNQRINCG